MVEKTIEKQEDIQFNIGELVVKQGTVNFPEYETIKQQALNLSTNMKKVEVTNENIQVSKQLLAAVTKEVRRLNDERIKVKRTILQPYDDLEVKIKEITDIVKKADDIVRSQVRELEERERQDKKELIESIFNKRMKQYEFGELMGFDKFLKPTHLNKSTSMTKIETDMVTWLTKVETDLELINSMEYSFEIIGEYQRTQDVASSIKSVMDRHKAIQEMERKAEVITPSPQQSKPKKPTILIELTDEKDVKLVEMFMKQEDIEYTKTVR